MTTTLRKTATLLLALLPLLGQAPVAHAADEPDEDEPEEHADAPWSLALATLVDQASTRGLNVQVGRDVGAANTVQFVADSTDYTSINQAGFKSQGVELGLLHEFERFDVKGAVARWQDTDILTAKELKLDGDLHFDPWSVGLRTGYRRANFDPFTSKVPVTLKNGTTIDAATRSTCSLDNTALGLDGRYEGDIWGFYATAMNYQYKDASCRFLLSGAAVRAGATRAELSALSGGVLDRLTAVATRRIGRDQTLLDSSLDAGTSWKHDDLIVSLDYSRQKDYLVGAISNTYSVTGTADLGDHAGVDCTLGITRGAGVSQGAFVGFGVRARF
ncbi:MAG: hypothetical protein JSR54_08545 [Proteobacteria bacterium]|nr:hypothetical protein [Pseudomonadota bacterium]